ncbi:MAG: late competence development ComFB family protein [Halanaerobiaceae bacterium]
MFFCKGRIYIISLVFLLKEAVTINSKEISPHLKNHTEEIVLETIEDLINNSEFDDICKCQLCLIDIATYALNKLPARYIASREGEVQTKINEFESQIKVDTISAVTKAIQTVSNKPRH